MKNADRVKAPVRKPDGEGTPLSRTRPRDGAKDDHYDVTGTKTAHAYYTGGFGWAGENTNQPGDGPTPHRQKHGLTTDERLPKAKVTERSHRVDSKMTHPGKPMNPGGAKKVTSNSTYPYDDGEAPVDALHETNGDEELRITVSHMGVQADDQGQVHDSTWGEFLSANPDLEPEEQQEILGYLKRGKAYTCDLPHGGVLKIIPGGASMKTNETCSAGAVGAGAIGGSPGMLFGTKRTTEEDQLDPEEQTIVEFVRNGVPYRGRIISRGANTVLINVGGRHLVVEASIIDKIDDRPAKKVTGPLSGEAGDSEPESSGPTRYGQKTPKQDHAMSSPTAPNATMKKFIGSGS